MGSHNAIFKHERRHERNGFQYEIGYKTQFNSSIKKVYKGMESIKFY